MLVDLLTTFCIWLLNGHRAPILCSAKICWEAGVGALQHALWTLLGEWMVYALAYNGCGDLSCESYSLQNGACWHDCSAGCD